MRKFNFMFVFLLLLGVTVGQAQSRSVSGIVISAENAEPVIGATVRIKDTGTGTITDYNGNFSLSVPDISTILVFSYVGMKTMELPARDNMLVQLESDSEQLDEIMVVAYGTARKESFTGSAEVIKPEKLEKRTVANVTKAIDGLVTGVQSTSGSGQPGADAKMIIRGFGSINASQNPLYVIDGIPYDGEINAINPNDIESVTVLKDASAGALYGSRGANGVVMITTKKGQEGKTKVNLKASWGISSRAIPRYETLDAKGYIENVYHAYRTDILANYDVDKDVAGQLAIEAMTDGFEYYAPVFRR